MGGNHFRETEQEYKDRQRGPSGRKLRDRGEMIRVRRGLQHCCKRDVMHMCTECDSPDKQKLCSFHIPTSAASRCMELRWDVYCTSQTLHQYMEGGISDGMAKERVKNEKTRISKHESRLQGYHIIFPLEGEETKEDLQHIWNQLAHLGIGTPEFWMDADGKDAGPHFSITVDDVKNGTWVPKRKELIKDILRYFEIRTKFNC